MESKLYTKLKPQEIENEIESYNKSSNSSSSSSSSSSKPPLVLLKKILINLTIGNLHLIEHDIIFAFTCKIILKFGNNKALKN